MIHGTFQGDQSPRLQEFLWIRPLVRLSFSSGISILQECHWENSICWTPSSIHGLRAGDHLSFSQASNLAAIKCISCHHTFCYAIAWCSWGFLRINTFCIITACRPATQFEISKKSKCIRLAYASYTLYLIHKYICGNQVPLDITISFYLLINVCTAVISKCS